MEIQELAERNPNNDFRFQIEDRRQVEYEAPKAPKPVLKPFEGKGNSLNGYAEININFLFTATDYFQIIKFYVVHRGKRNQL